MDYTGVMLPITSALHADVLTPEVAADQARALAQLGATADPATPVPTCGDWTLADLVWHLTEVQRFWVHIIGNRPAGPESYERPTRPPTEELPDELRQTADSLFAALDGLAPSEHAWSWAVEQTVGFTIRRQCHEALIHHLDGVLAVSGTGLEAPPELWADGVDEVLTVMAGVDEGSPFEARGPSVALHATDVDDRWTIELGVVPGEEQEGGGPLEAVRPSRSVVSGVAVDHDGAPTPDAGTVVRGSAESLDLWLWGRPGGAVDLGEQPDLGRELLRVARLGAG